MNNPLRTSWRLAPPVCVIAIVCAALTGQRATCQPQSAPEAFSFVTAGDMRNFVGPAPAGKRYFDGLCEALQTIGAGAFMIIPGDCDPPGPIRATIDRYLGTNYVWYPVIGNHEFGNKTNMVWLRDQAKAGIPHLTHRGPPHMR